MRKLRGLLSVISIIAVSLIIPLISKYVLELLKLDRYGNSLHAYILSSIVFYIMQIGLTVLIIKFIYNYPITRMGLNLENWKSSLSLTLRFIAVWITLVIFFYFICLNFVPNFNHYIEYY